MRDNNQLVDKEAGTLEGCSRLEMYTGMGMTGIPRISWESRGRGRLVCGVPAGMEVNAAGSRGDGKNCTDSRGFNLLTSKLLAETVHQPIFSRN